MSEVTTPYAPGTPCWVDLTAADQQAALDFYTGLFGWSGQVGPPDVGGYSVCTLRGKAVAGIMAGQPAGDGPAPPTGWTTYLASADASATEAAITEAGGTVVAPTMDVMDLGRMLVAADPTGAVFGIWQAKEFQGAQIVNEANAVVWNELNTTDVKAAIPFYKAVLGIDAEPMRAEGAEGYYTLSVQGRPVGGLQFMPKAAPPGTHSHWLTYFAVEDTDDAVSRLTAAGGRAVVQPHDMIAGRLAIAEDSQGSVLGVIKPKPMESGG
ncbi:VOC family protein [Streptomyces palmae]|uniref:VOC family protein n=1 Tax=Streptomyces palmae TaxID=1701085 RepID=A0A4Z0FWD9_9ACTN|nr:VOC family protein [Streptomyces palmae]TGA87444.1 VOC family protein [Streptomyces palmae]